MPIYQAPPYHCPLGLRGEHLETIIPNVTRRRFRLSYRRERIELADGDFVDIDFSKPSCNDNIDTCVLAMHGLEGSSGAPYVKSLSRCVNRLGWDFAALNFRGCSGEMNRKARFYHSGDTGDVDEVARYLLMRYDRLALVGFSLGGNVVLKYMGENSDCLPKGVRAAVSISAPIDLEGSALRIGRPSNRFYMKRFIRLLSEKIERKAKLFPEDLDAEGCRELDDFEAFDGRYTAPLNGFASAEDYWKRSSALNWLQDITRPSLLLNARNDPFLTEACFPEVLASQSDMFYATFPERGGHLGFPGARKGGMAWHERVCLAFLQEKLAD
ncbi:YheT family hydrolase [Pelagicoccus albus]|uniref:Alpha/beta fold hydrolase n=1 Tax=Pelagicoccus albus TaxID=415222 RepID=A0A7X1B7G6_9BACT|nr:alpha/beta fold hydrolase [Pelagicoccus albus]MBC2606819.1 alpha/beta fold hydrolase [Pelagicoccus albus]